ncbi:glycosyltransferase family 2 protein [Nostoc sp. FACHB-87]|uniref:glycosyltransferase family 2 protein n=1 Tax=Nostocaceae TaxID=1162 RepID=UPI0016828880|nr:MULTISPECIES: glycosyltransferase family A protein [Nostocaceae]MBD2454316.1 glycosyltransferase family 2 protein [Nostoc sp. FACHB-87]MBD2474091.1 glycosyltransferase family 2 protein [Anabaena sp. FACHB-83]
MNSSLPGQPIVSVIVPTFNRANFLSRAISSILQQTFSNFELIIVDDGSTDNTAEVVKEFTDPRIKFLPLGKNYGGSYARNQGIKAASTEFIAFLDSDDEWLPEKLELQVKRLQESDDPLATVVYCLGYECVEGQQKIPSLHLYEGDVFDDLLRGWLPPTTSLFMVKRSALLEVNGFDESLPSFQDYDLWLSLAAANNHFLVVDKPLIIRYFHPQQIGGNLQAKLEGLRIFKNKWGTVIKQRTGAINYHRVIGVRTSIVQLLRVNKELDKGNKITALFYILALLKFLPWSGELFAKGIIRVIFGAKVYKLLFELKYALFYRNQNKSSTAI